MKTRSSYYNDADPDPLVASPDPRCEITVPLGASYGIGKVKRRRLMILNAAFEPGDRALCRAGDARIGVLRIPGVIEMSDFRCWGVAVNHRQMGRSGDPGLVGCLSCFATRKVLSQKPIAAMGSTAWFRESVVRSALRCRSDALPSASSGGRPCGTGSAGSEDSRFKPFSESFVCENYLVVASGTPRGLVAVHLRR